MLKTLRSGTQGFCRCLPQDGVRIGASVKGDVMSSRKRIVGYVSVRGPHRFGIYRAPAVSDQARLLEADSLRRQAMIAADTDALQRLLSDELIWTHSSGKAESKVEVINALADGAVAYTALEMTQDRVLHAGGSYIHQGVLRGSAVRDGEMKLLHARFLSVWQEVGNQFQLVAWQSTNLS